MAIQSSIGQIPTNTTYWDKIAGKGDTGNGISSITKTSTSGLVDTYTITFTNGQTTSYEITNGANGDVVDVQVDGTSVVDNGVANIVGLAEMKQELEDMYNLLPKVSGTGETITLNNTVVGKMLIDLKGNTSQEGTPTPASPQTIHVVKGNNTITISNSDNTQSQNYSINLGDIELCKIGTYQDYIYKSGNNWYKKQYIKKLTLNENSGFGRNNATGVFYLSNITDYLKEASLTTYANYYQSIINVSSINDVGENKISVSTGNSNRVFINDQNHSTVDSYKTWLSTHNITFYYVLNTPTDVQITDSNLINQLETIKRSFNTQTNITQTNTDLAFNIEATALVSLQNS